MTAPFTTTEQELVAVALASWEINYSKAQRLLLLIVPMISGSLSLLGSSLILFMLYKRGSIKQSLPDRIMACTSVADVIVSFWIILGGVTVPKETGGPLALGTWTTCETSGFFTHFSYTVGIYNVCLLLYSLCRIRYRWRENQIAARMEKYMHCIAIAYPLTTGIYGLIINAFNPLPMGLRRCFVAIYPPRCQLFENCTRPNSAGKQYAIELVPIILNTIPTTTLIVIFFIILTMIYLAARKTYKRSDHMNSRNMRAMANQSMLYGIFFFLSYIWTLVLTITTVLSDTLGSQPKPPPFGLVLCFEIFWPLQGFFNFVTFTRPRYNRIRSLCSRGGGDNDDRKSITWVIKETIFGEPLTSLKYHHPRRRKNPQDQKRIHCSSSVNSNSSKQSNGNESENKQIDVITFPTTKEAQEATTSEKMNVPHQGIVAVEKNSGSVGVPEETTTTMMMTMNKVSERKQWANLTAADTVFEGDIVDDGSSEESSVPSLDIGVMPTNNVDDHGQNMMMIDDDDPTTIILEKSQYSQTMHCIDVDLEEDSHSLPSEIQEDGNDGGGEELSRRC